MQFAYLGSGSRGNAAIIEAGQTCLMLDCGFSVRETVRRLARLERDGTELSGILLTHEHSDHVAGVGVVARRFNVPVWTTSGTLRAAANRLGKLPAVNVIDPEQVFAIDDIEVNPYPVPHDAREPVQFVFSDGNVRLGILTDVGQSTPHIETMLSGCDSLALECNHDRRMLMEGPYPPALKSRVAGGQGHLDNDTAAQLLSRLDTGKLQHLVAVHLSETNNTPALARHALCNETGCDAAFIQVADQDQGLPWHAIA
jgi:phosphoribosyl 1,2-cyclic phosphodiesterase